MVVAVGVSLFIAPAVVGGVVAIAAVGTGVGGSIVVVLTVKVDEESAAEVEELVCK